MLFGVIILVLVAGIAYYHYVQGFFSALLSVVMVIMAMAVAISYHEIVAEKLLASVMPNAAHAVGLVGLFALTYFVARQIADRLVPGNIRLHVMVEKIGAGALGLFAGIFSVGILAIAAQMLPFGPSIAGFSRYPVRDREANGLVLAGVWRKQDLIVHDELDVEAMTPARAKSMFPLAVDNMTLGLASYLSGGSLAGTRLLTAVHPSYLDELFAQRLGPARGGDVMFPAEGKQPLTVTDVYTGDRILIQPEDFEVKDVRSDRVPTAYGGPDTIPVVIRATMEPLEGGHNAINMGSVRLVVRDQDYYPIGSYQNGRLLMTRPDDMLFINGSAPVDYVFIVPAEMLAKDSAGAHTLPAGSFLEAKRGSRFALEGREISTRQPSFAGVGVVEKDKAPRLR